VSNDFLSQSKSSPWFQTVQLLQESMKLKDENNQAYNIMLAVILLLFACCMVGYAFTLKQYPAAGLYLLLATCSIVSMIYDSSMMIAFQATCLGLILICILAGMGIVTFLYRNRKTLFSKGKKKIDPQNLSKAEHEHLKIEVEDPKRYEWNQMVMKIESAILLVGLIGLIVYISYKFDAPLVKLETRILLIFMLIIMNIFVPPNNSPHYVVPKPFYKIFVCAFLFNRKIATVVYVNAAISRVVRQRDLPHAVLDSRFIRRSFACSHCIRAALFRCPREGLAILSFSYGPCLYGYCEYYRWWNRDWLLNWSDWVSFHLVWRKNEKRSLFSSTNSINQSFRQ
jgi:cell division protein FtsL